MRLLGLMCFLSLACSSTTTVNPADSGSADVSQPDDGGAAEADAPSSSCSAAIASLLNPINSVTTGTVSIVSTSGSTRTVYIDATAGGFGNETMNPRTYVNLETATRVDITDKQAPTSTAWDLAFKRPVIFTNGGDGGPGMGGTIIVNKSFDQVTSADATGTFTMESFVDAACNPKKDQTGDILTTFDPSPTSDWYDYDMSTMLVTPKANTTYVIKGGTGKLYKLALLNYYGTPDGGMGMAGGDYLVEVAGL